MTNSTRIADWEPIETAPPNLPVMVTDGNLWTLARRVQIDGQTLQLRWPFLRNVSWWRWVFSCSRRIEIDFTPTHWAYCFLVPPLGLNND